MPDTIITAIQPTASEDAVINQFTEEAAEQIKSGVLQTLYAVKDPANFKLKNAKVVAQDSTESETTGNVVKAMLETKPKASQQAVLSKLNSSVVSTAKMKMSILKNNLDLKSSKYVLDQPGAIDRFSFVNKNYITRLATGVEKMSIPEMISNGVDTVASMVSPVPNRTLLLQIKRVYCNDETGGWWAETFGGTDEIDMGGVAINDRGQSQVIPAFRVGNFNDGTNRVYNPARTLHSFALDNTYPNFYTVFIGLTEKDYGNAFVSFLARLHSAVKSELTSILAKIAVRLGSTLGGLLGGKVAEILGSIAVRILGSIINWLKGWFGDDVFEPRVVALRLPNSTFDFPGAGNQSATQSVIFNGHSGTYTVYYSWELKK